MSYEPEFVTSLVDHMNRVLEVVVQTFGQAGVALPERQYITFGQAVHDCEQVTVAFQQLYMGPPGDQAQQAQHCEGPRSAAVTVEIVRCIPVAGGRTGKLSVPQLTSLAQQQGIDSWMLLEAATNMDPYAGILADVSAGEAGGGFQAMTMSLIMAV